MSPRTPCKDINQWIQGQSELEVRQRWYVFVEISARVLHRTKQEIVDELKSTTWFKIDDKIMLAGGIGITMEAKTSI